jgi:hypothetical protein
MVEKILLDIEGKLEEQMNAAKLRRDQMLMYAILGDPATRLHLPQRLRGKIKFVDGKWNWQVTKPEGTTVLHVGFRASGQKFPQLNANDKNVDLDKLFAQADDTFAFKPLKKLGNGDKWAGTLKGEGTLRLVAIGPGKIYAAGIKLVTPRDAPKPMGKPKQ